MRYCALITKWEIIFETKAQSFSMKCDDAVIRRWEKVVTKIKKNLTYRC